MEYDVCLSFAGEDRAYVDRVARILSERGIRVFYDRFEEAGLWGKDLYQHFADVYQARARYCVIFASEHYARKAWTRHELASAQSRAVSQSSEYILPARFDDTAIPGLLPTTCYVDLRERTPEEFADIVADKVAGLTVPAAVAPDLVSELAAMRLELERLRRQSIGRQVAPETAERLRAALSMISPSPLKIASAPADEEAAQYRDQLASVFRSVGWDVSATTAIYAMEIIGVEVVHMGGERWEEAIPVSATTTSISLALREAGIPNQLAVLRERPKEFESFLAVGRKPRGA